MITRSIAAAAVLTLLSYLSAAAELPGYWADYLPGRVAEIRADMKKAAGHGETFVFITDIHVPHNSMMSPSLIREVMDRTGIDWVIMAGDYMNAHATAKTGLETMEKYLSLFSFTDPVVLRGNHDTNYVGYQAVTDEQFLSLVRKYSRRSYTNGDRMYFALDDKRSRIRHIFLDTGDDNNKFVEEDQLRYLEQQIKSAPKGWHAAVFLHIFLRGQEAAKGIVAPGLYEDGRRVKAVLDRLYGKTRADIIGVFCGHNHTDFHMYSEAGYPIIATTCDSGEIQASYWDPRQPLRPRGTIHESAFDVVTIDTDSRMIYMKRIGAGVDRQFRY
ncbi:MAG: metallophosphoesterase [Abditibacteriota bacterium]|nr:metallophosphoesterase [Abditibacteriota bacterium]